jgi:hypothetical protein
MVHPQRTVTRRLCAFRCGLRLAQLTRASLLILPTFFPMELPMLLPPTIKFVGPLLPRPGKPLQEPFASLLAGGPTLVFRCGAHAA